MAFIVIPAADIASVTVTDGAYAINPIIKINGDGVVNDSVLSIPNLDPAILAKLQSYSTVSSVSPSDFPPPLE